MKVKEGAVRLSIAVVLLLHAIKPAEPSDLIIIATVAGNGTTGFDGDGGPATVASLNYPLGMAVDDNGVVYIADWKNNRIRRVGTDGIINTIAGTGVDWFGGDGGPATQAEIYSPTGVAIDAQWNLLIAEGSRIRRVDTNGLTSTFAGTENKWGYAGDGGLATQAELDTPHGVAIDPVSGGVYISDRNNHRIRRVDASGIITTFAGTGVAGFSGDGGQAINAQIHSPLGITVNGSGAVYFADAGNYCIRRVGTNGIISTVAGTPGSWGTPVEGAVATQTPLNGPKGVAIDANGALYITDPGEQKIFRVGIDGAIRTFAGTGSIGFSGDGGPATEAEMFSPEGITIDGNGVLYVADTSNQRIRKIGPASLLIPPTGSDGTLKATFVIQAMDGANGLRDTIRVQVSDPDLDMDNGQIETTTIFLENRTSGEREQIQVTETEANSGIFHGSIPTQFGSSGVDGDGMLVITLGDQVAAQYEDNFTSTGGNATLEANINVVRLFGDVTGNGAVRAYDANQILGFAVQSEIASFEDSLEADVDGDSQILVADASFVLQYIVGYFNRFPVQIDVALNGDSDWKNHPFLKPIAARSIVKLGVPEPQESGNFLLPLTLTEREGIVSGTVAVRCDHATDIEDVVLVKEYSNFLLTYHISAKGLRIAFAGSESPAAGSGTVALLRIRPTEAEPLRFQLDEAFLNGKRILVSSEKTGQSIVLVSRAYCLHQNYPNPFNPSTTIRYLLPEAAYLNLRVFNLAGQSVRVLVDKEQSAGEYRVVWDGMDDSGRIVTNGLYLYRISAGRFSETKKMILLN